MSDAFRERLAERLRAAGVAAPTELETSSLETYFELLARWNARINLTALPLEGVPAATIDRLFVEPLAAADYVLPAGITWFDVGSGGGSPAIPLKVLRPQARVTMIESRGRKAAFLREAVRTLDLPHAEVHEGRFEAFATLQAHRRTAHLVTLRAVRPEPEMLQLCREVLSPGGTMLLFQSTSQGSVQLPAGLRRKQTSRLGRLEAFADVLEAI